MFLIFCICFVIILKYKKKNVTKEGFRNRRKTMDTVLDKYCKDQYGNAGNNYEGPWLGDSGDARCGVYDCPRENCKTLVNHNNYNPYNYVYQENIGRMIRDSNIDTGYTACRTKHNNSNNIICDNSFIPSCDYGMNNIWGMNETVFSFDSNDKIWRETKINNFMNSNGQCYWREVNSPFNIVNILDTVSKTNIKGDTNSSNIYYDKKPDSCRLTKNGNRFFNSERVEIVNLEKDDEYESYDLFTGDFVCANNTKIKYDYSNDGFSCSFNGTCSSCTQEKSSCYEFNSDTKDYNKNNFIKTYHYDNNDDISEIKVCDRYLIKSDKNDEFDRMQINSRSDQINNDVLEDIIHQNGNTPYYKLESDYNMIDSVGDSVVNYNIASNNYNTTKNNYLSIGGSDSVVDGIITSIDDIIVSIDSGNSDDVIYQKIQQRSITDITINNGTTDIINSAKELIVSVNKRFNSKPNCYKNLFQCEPDILEYTMYGGDLTSDELKIYGDINNFNGTSAIRSIPYTDRFYNVKIVKRMNSNGTDCELCKQSNDTDIIEASCDSNGTVYNDSPLVCPIGYNYEVGESIMGGLSRQPYCRKCDSNEFYHTQNSNCEMLSYCQRGEYYNPFDHIHNTGTPSNPDFKLFNYDNKSVIGDNVSSVNNVDLTAYISGSYTYLTSNYHKSCDTCPINEYSVEGINYDCTSCPKLDGYNRIQTISINNDSCDTCVPSNRRVTQVNTGDIIRYVKDISTTNRSCDICPELGTSSDYPGQKIYSISSETENTTGICYRECIDGRIGSNNEIFHGSDKPSRLNSSGIGEYPKCDFICPLNYIKSNGTCEPCPIGEFNNDPSNTTCESCQIGTFNSEPGQGCQQCPSGNHPSDPTLTPTTTSTGSTSISDCKIKCTAESTSSNIPFTDDGLYGKYDFNDCPSSTCEVSDRYQRSNLETDGKGYAFVNATGTQKAGSDCECTDTRNCLILNSGYVCTGNEVNTNHNGVQICCPVNMQYNSDSNTCECKPVNQIYNINGDSKTHLGSVQFRTDHINKCVPVNNSDCLGDAEVDTNKCVLNCDGALGEYLAPSSSTNSTCATCPQSANAETIIYDNERRRCIIDTCSSDYYINDEGTACIKNCETYELIDYNDYNIWVSNRKPYRTAIDSNENPVFYKKTTEPATTCPTTAIDPLIQSTPYIKVDNVININEVEYGMYCPEDKYIKRNTNNYEPFRSENSLCCPSNTDKYTENSTQSKCCPSVDNSISLLSETGICSVSCNPGYYDSNNYCVEYEVCPSTYKLSTNAVVDNLNIYTLVENNNIRSGTTCPSDDIDGSSLSISSNPKCMFFPTDNNTDIFCCSNDDTVISRQPGDSGFTCTKTCPQYLTYESESNESYYTITTIRNNNETVLDNDVCPVSTPEPTCEVGFIEDTNSQYTKLDTKTCTRTVDHSCYKIENTSMGMNYTNSNLKDVIACPTDWIKGSFISCSDIYTTTTTYFSNGSKIYCCPKRDDIYFDDFDGTCKTNNCADSNTVRLDENQDGSPCVCKESWSNNENENENENGVHTYSFQGKDDSITDNCSSNIKSVMDTKLNNCVFDTDSNTYYCCNEEEDEDNKPYLIPSGIVGGGTYTCSNVWTSKIKPKGFNGYDLDASVYHQIDYTLAKKINHTDSILI